MSEAPVLPSEALALLPDADTAMRCAAYSESIDVDPGGTAICADAVVIVETPLPWPKPVFAHQLLTGLKSMMETSMGPARVLAAVPADPDDLRVIVYERTPTGATGTEHRPDDPVAFVVSLRDTNPQDLPHEPAAESAVLICTQGSHDICCGAEGTDLAIAAEARLDAPVYRVSHTGGHRFAPTAMTLPDGRMWAHLDLDDLTEITAGLGASADRCRGWWGASTGPAQVAERAVLAQVGVSLDATERRIESIETADGWQCVVDADDQRWDVEVVLGRIVPTIACREVGGLPAKPGREYAVRSISAQ